MNIVFLDFDGVVNTVQYMERKGKVGYAFPHDCFVNNRTAVEFINKLCKETDSNIVVSSTWRIGCSLNELRKILKNSGCDVHVIGKTPVLGGRRGNEIQAWIDDNYGLVSDFVIIDDDTDMAHLKHKLVKCDPILGFHVDAYFEAIKLFQMDNGENRYDYL